MFQSDHIVFSDVHIHYAVGFVDIVDSTLTVSRLSGRQADSLYAIVLNTLSDTIVHGGGVVIKTVGDGIMFYFPKTDFGALADYENVLRVCMDMLSVRDTINQQLIQNGLPEISYRISASFGPVSIVHSDQDEIDDLFGTTVNTCAKMNRLAQPNSLIIGSALYQKVCKTELFSISEYQRFVLDDHFSYMTYMVSEK